MLRRLITAGCLATTLCTPWQSFASEPSARPLSPEAVAVYQLIYSRIPQQLAVIDAEIHAAVLRATATQARLDGYKPFRSFGRYGATYAADLAARADFAAALAYLECLQHQRDEMLAQRQALGVQLIQLMR